MFWVLAPRNTAEVVFTQFTDGGGWPSMGLALMVGQITALYACICSDAAAHMSEEIKVCLDATICFGNMFSLTSQSGCWSCRPHGHGRLLRPQRRPLPRLPDQLPVRHRRHRRRNQSPHRLSVPLRLRTSIQHGGCQRIDIHCHCTYLRGYTVIQPVQQQTSLGCTFWSFMYPGSISANMFSSSLATKVFHSSAGSRRLTHHWKYLVMLLC